MRCRWRCSKRRAHAGVVDDAYFACWMAWQGLSVMLEIHHIMGHGFAPDAPCCVTVTYDLGACRPTSATPLACC